MMMEKIRSFIAIEVPSSLLTQIGQLQEELRRTQADVKWVRPESIHLTLKFLGPVSEEALDKLSLAISPLIASRETFNLRIHGLGCFPSIRNPRVLWVGIDRGVEQISPLREAIERKAVELSFSPELRPFTPHLTIGRVRSSKGKEILAQAIETRKNIEIGAFQAEEVFLIKSKLTPSGAIYTRLKTFPMNANHV
jgi:2'-5' RNA ligase